MKTVLTFVGCALLLVQGSGGFSLGGLLEEMEQMGGGLVGGLLSGPQEQGRGGGIFGFNYADCEKIPAVLAEGKGRLAVAVREAAAIAQGFQEDVDQLMNCTNAGLFEIASCFSENIGKLKELEAAVRKNVAAAEDNLKEIALQLKIYFMACIGKGTIPTTTTTTVQPTTAASSPTAAPTPAPAASTTHTAPAA